MLLSPSDGTALKITTPILSLCALLVMSALSPLTLSAAPPMGDVREHVVLVAIDQSATVEKLSRDGADERTSQLALKKLTAEVAQRLERRLLAAGEHAEAKPMRGARVRVVVRTRQQRAWVEGILTGHGAMALREAQDQTGIWSELVAMLPQSVELRPTPQGTVAWSQDREALLTLTRKLTMGKSEFFVIPSQGGGWRTLLLKPPAVTQANLTRAERAQSNIGLPFIKLHLNSQGTAAMHSLARKTPMALVVDDEVIDVFRIPDTAQRADLSLRCSDIWVPPTQQVECVDVVVGRLAATLPMKITLITPSSGESP